MAFSIINFPAGPCDFNTYKYMYNLYKNIYMSLCKICPFSPSLHSGKKINDLEYKKNSPGCNVVAFYVKGVLYNFIQGMVNTSYYFHPYLPSQFFVCFGFVWDIIWESFNCYLRNPYCLLILHFLKVLHHRSRKFFILEYYDPKLDFKLGSS